MSKCIWCGGQTVINNGPATRLDWQRWRCKSCGMFGFVNCPSLEDLSAVYETAWKDSASSGSYAAGSTDEKIARSLLAAIDFKSNGSNCLDYGGGRGAVARALIEKGCENLTVYEPFGLNPGLSAVNWISDLNSLGQEKFEWIFMIEVVEHLRDPQAELMKIRQHLTPTGKLVITTPNARGWRARSDGFNWREAQNPTHINLFTAQSLKSILLAADYIDPRRVYRPVSYKSKGLKAFALAITQIIGIDGGLRFIALNSGN